MKRDGRLFHLAALASGMIFGLGLAISGMTNPEKVRAFLDVSAVAEGRWDPSLAFVMAAAVIVAMVAVRIAHRRRRPIAAPAFSRPTARRVDGELVVGSVLFGIGWGLAGLCPGPAIADLLVALPDILIFLAAMLAGSLLVSRWRLAGGRVRAEARDGKALERSSSP